MVVMIVEGVDLSGKTTAIERIAKHYNSGFILKNTYKPKQVDSLIYEQYWKILDLVKNLGVNYRKDNLIILDRFFPSQAVYSVLRGSDDLSCAKINILDNYCVRNKMVFVYLDTSLKDLKKRYKERGDEHIKITQLEVLKERYDQFYENTKMIKIKIDTTNKDWFELVKLVLEELK
jgi:thymidylate kinase